MIVLYQSKYGATERYAKWLADTLGCAAEKTADATLEMLVPQETIIFCGGVYARGIEGIGFLKKHYPALQGKRLAVLAVGASPSGEAAVRELRARNFYGMLQPVPCFYARGAWNEKKMKRMDRFLCRALQWAIRKKKLSEMAPWESALISAAGRVEDWTDPAYLAPVLDWAKDGLPQ